MHFARSSASWWLEHYAWEYGFVLAYPRGEEERTGGRPGITATWVFSTRNGSKIVARACSCSWRVWGLHPTFETRHVADRDSLAEMGNEEKPSVARGTYSLPEELAHHSPGQLFAPDELRGACHEAGEGLGREDARKARFRTAAQMVAMWRGLDLPAWEAPYVLRDARLGYLNGYKGALISGEMSEQQIDHAAESRWGERWPERLRSARERSG